MMMFLLSNLAIQFIQNNLFLFAQIVLEAESQFSYLLLTIEVSTLINLVIWGRLAARFSKKSVYVVGNLVFVCVVASLFFVPPGTLWLMFILSAVAGVVSAIILFCIAPLPSCISSGSLTRWKGCGGRLADSLEHASGHDRRVRISTWPSLRRRVLQARVAQLSVVTGCILTPSCHCQRVCSVSEGRACTRHGPYAPTISLFSLFLTCFFCSLAVSNFVVAANGFVSPPPAHELLQPARVRDALRLLLGPVPAVLLILSFIPAILYPITRENHTAMLARLHEARKDRQAMAAAEDVVKADTVESRALLADAETEQDVIDIRT
jgi:MFS family permease